MGIKGKIKPDHIPVNKYMLILETLPLIMTLTNIGAIEEDLDRVDLPDRTRASGGNTKAIETTIKQPMHHSAEVAQMEGWFEECQDPVSINYKKVGSLLGISLSGETIRSYALDGVFLTKRALPEWSMENEGDMAEIEWGLSIDDIMPSS